MSKSIINRQQWQLGEPSAYATARDILSLPTSASDIPFGSMQSGGNVMETVSVVIDDVDIDADGKRDSLMAKIFRTPSTGGDAKAQWHAFIAGTLGRSSSSSISTDASFDNMVEQADFVFSRTNSAEPTEQDIISFVEQHIQRALCSIGEDVASSAHDILSSCLNSLGYFGVEIATQQGPEDELEAFYESARTQCAQSLSFAVPFLERSAAAAVEPGYAQRLKNASREIRRFNMLSADGLAAINSHLEFTRSIHDAAPPSSKDDAQRSWGGFIDGGEQGFIADANGIAMDHGFGSYADYQLKMRYDLSPGEYRTIANKLLDDNLARINRARNEIKRMDPSAVIDEDNIWRLLQRKLTSRLRNEAGRDSDPHMTLDEALAVAKSFYRDLGFDLDHINYDTAIVFDFQQREGKAAGLVSAMEDGRRTWIGISPPANGHLSLTDLQTIIHEIAHAIHYYLGSLQSESNATGGSMMCSKTWMETVAQSLGSIVLSEDFIIRYLSHIDGFNNPAVAGILVQELTDQAAYLDTTIILATLWELGLYEDPNSCGSFSTMEQRLESSRQLSERYLALDPDASLPSSQTLSFKLKELAQTDPFHNFAHAGGKLFGAELATPIRNALLSGNPDRISSSFAPLRSLMEIGGGIFSVEDARETLCSSSN